MRSDACLNGLATDPRLNIYILGDVNGGCGTLQPYYPLHRARVRQKMKKRLVQLWSGRLLPAHKDDVRIWISRRHIHTCTYYITYYLVGSTAHIITLCDISTLKSQSSRSSTFHHSTAAQAFQRVQDSCMHILGLLMIDLRSVSLAERVRFGAHKRPIG